MTEEQSDVAKGKPLTTWKNAPTIKDLKQNITDGELEQTRHANNVKRWMDNRSVTGSAATSKVKGKSSIAPKLIRKQNEWRYSSLSEPFLSTPDLFNIAPVTAGDKERAKQNSMVLNNQFNTKLRKTHFVDSLVREGVDIGTVIIKLGWETEEELTESEPEFSFEPAQDPALAERFQGLTQLREENPEEYADYSTPELDTALDLFAQTGQMFIVTQIGEKPVTRMIETKNQPTWEIMNSENVIVDPSCNGDVDKISFFGERFKSSKANLEKDGKYHNLEFINTESASPIADPDYAENADTETFTFQDKPRKQFIVHTYWGTWDINGDGVLHQIIASWVGDIMVRLELNPFPFKKPPFVVINYMPVRRSIFGEPDAELLEDNQRIIGAVTRGIIDTMARSANGQTGIKKGVLDVTNARKFKKGEDYEFNSNEDPRFAIYHHTYPEISRSAYDMIALQNTDAESLTGVKAYSSGISGQSLGDVATGVRGALDAASKRELGILRRFAAGVVEIGHMMISMNAEWLSEEETIRITADEFIQVRRDDLAGKFDLSLSISTAEEDNKKAEELAFMLQTTGPNSDPGEVRMIRAEIARLRKMPDLAKRIEEYQPQPDPLVEEEKRLKVLLLEKQIAKEEALTQKHLGETRLSDTRGEKELTQAGLNIDKGQTERAKAKQLGSDADLKDLDYLERETGTHQERELQKINVKSKNDGAAQIGAAMIKDNVGESA
jgi:hypothetical protein